jgi:hypothetical protein
MDLRRPALAASLLISFAVPLAVTAGAATAAPAAASAATPVRSLCAPPSDTVGPVVSKVTFGRKSVNLNSGSLVQTVTATASDTSGKGPASGVAALTLAITGPNSYTGLRLKLTSGTPASGRWTGSLTVSKYVHTGTFSVDYLNVSDLAGNSQQYDVAYNKIPDGPNSLSLNPADAASFTITGTPAKRPTPKPAGSLSALTLSSASVNTTAAAHGVKVSARITGAAPLHVSVNFNTATKTAPARSVYLNVVLHLSHGTWSGTLIVPRWLGKQVLRPNLFIDFGAGYTPSYRSYNPDQLALRHLANTLTVLSSNDTSKPVLKSLSFSPKSVNSTDGSEKVTITAKATDTVSGVSSIDVNGSIQGGINGVAAGSYPFGAAGIGYLSSNYFSAELKKTSSGAWVGSTTFRKCVPSGAYKLNVSVSDAAENGRYYSTTQLATAKITSTLHVTSEHGDVAPPYVYSAATYGADSELFLNFSEGVAHVSTSTLTVYALSPASDSFKTPSTITSIVCANGKTTVDCSGASGLVTSAVLIVPSMMPSLTYDVYANLRQVTTQLTDGNRNPLSWNDAATEVKDS